MRRSAELSLLPVACVALILPFLLGQNAAANIHGVERLHVVPADAPPIYDLGQIEDEVADTIRRTERNLKIQVAMLEIDPWNTNRSDCGDPGSLFGLEIFCEMAVGIANTVETAIRRAESQETIQQLQQRYIESDPALAPDLAADVDRLLSSNFIQLRLANAVSAYVSANTAINVIYDPAAPPPDHRLETSLLRVEAVGSRVDSSVRIRLRGQASLINDADGAIVDSYEYAVETPAHFIESWSQGGIGLLAASVTAGIAKMAEVLAEETLLTVTSPRQRRKGYLLEAVSPLNKRCLLSCDFTGMEAYGYYETETLQPTFEWQDFVEVYATEPLYPDADATALEVVYDMRIHQSRLITIGQARLPGTGNFEGQPLLMTGEMEYEFRDIASTRFTPEIELVPCKPYTWTVRARFVADGKTHLTHWSGNYDEKDIETYRRRLISESGGARMGRAISGFMGIDQQEYYREEGYYFPFLATPAAADCSPEYIRSTMTAQ